VFFGLWHPAFAGVDDEETTVDAADTRKHVAKKSNVSGNVDERDVIDVREPEVDRETAPLLLFEFVGVDAGECANE
jgi:hypothetical protein